MGAPLKVGDDLTRTRLQRQFSSLPACQYPFLVLRRPSQDTHGLSFRVNMNDESVNLRVVFFFFWIPPASPITARARA